MGDFGQMTFSNRPFRFITIAALLAAMTVVASCRKEEQGRILVYEKGTYLGKPDQKLTDAQEQELRFRARNQAF